MSLQISLSWQVTWWAWHISLLIMHLSVIGNINMKAKCCDKFSPNQSNYKLIYHRKEMLTYVLHLCYKYNAAISNSFLIWFIMPINANMCKFVADLILYLHTNWKFMSFDNFEYTTFHYKRFYWFYRFNWKHRKCTNLRLYAHIHSNGHRPWNT